MKVTYIKEIDGAVWARLFLDYAVEDGPVHVMTEKELRAIRQEEYKKAWDNIKSSISKWEGDYD